MAWCFSNTRVARDASSACCRPLSTRRATRRRLRRPPTEVCRIHCSRPHRVGVTALLETHCLGALPENDRLLFFSPAVAYAFFAYPLGTSDPCLLTKPKSR